MSKTYALVNKETKIVEDLIIWDGESWIPEEYYTLYDIIAADESVKGYPANPGDTYNSELNGFVPPAPDDAEKFYLDEETLLWQVLPEFRGPKPAHLL